MSSLKEKLINMYVKCGELADARKVFDDMKNPNSFSWNVIIAAYQIHGYPHEALTLFNQMQGSDAQPNHFTFASILPACAKIRDLEKGMKIHQSIMERGCLSDVVVATALLDMYAKCGSINKARELFEKMPQRNMVTWNAMITGYTQNGVLDEALKLFKEMSQQDVISWNTMIAGYMQNGFDERALEIFKQMHFAGLKPNSATFASVLPACAKLGALEHGVKIHQSIIESGSSPDVVVARYAQNGFFEKALETFRKMQSAGLTPDSTTFASILPACAQFGTLEQGRGYAQNGFSKDALQHFELMKNSGTYPDRVSFACVLFACSHAGLVDEGCKYLNDMSNPYCLTPTIDHYVCMVDLLGRAGCLEETLNFIIKMPIKPEVVVWMCLLGACRSHKNIDLGIFAATLLFELDPGNVAPYVLLSNVYSEVGRKAVHIWNKKVEEVENGKRKMLEQQEM
ncbi:pentatricopeptide repeat-containing protein At2g13600 [Cryptomeria japonica]|uniref:pentatricopeptide repeat-containing protein At2g13600 n=1 Tax=Cryptomeria japonica TaxID=3369 RepID=UPI0027DA8A01|nr:pentatricopeptide repeat-containing protein At2g13600 [Cryptomeria japonica]